MTLSLPIAANMQEPSPDDDPYVSYAYSYPHKSAYGPIDPPVPLADVWSAEPTGSLFLYFHIPFCSMRCGFCNLFARAGGDEAYVDAYLDALERQARAVSTAIGSDRTITRIALGGGTPTYLSPAQLQRVFDIADRYFDARPAETPTSVETSPETATPDRLRCLRERGVERVSIGVQSFFDDDNRAIGRPQDEREVLAALDRLRAFPIFNIDLIYGQPGQTVGRWLDSLHEALRFQPGELYLYPLYVRPKTGIGRREQTQRLSASRMRTCYREACAILTNAGYVQISMRFFQRREKIASAGPVYCCQSDGMIGLGCGARSYASRLHYSSPFAVDAPGVHAILEQWTQQTDRDFAHATWGCRLSEDDGRRRYVIQSLLTLPGLVEAEHARVFGPFSEEIRTQLHWLMEQGMLERDSGVYRLTALGFEFSDTIGPSFYAPSRRACLEAFAQS